jgi:hypothetical protein
MNSHAQEGWMQQESFGYVPPHERQAEFCGRAKDMNQQEETS